MGRTDVALVNLCELALGALNAQANSDQANGSWSKILRLKVLKIDREHISMGPWHYVHIGKRESKAKQSSTESEVGVVYTTDRSSALQNRCLTYALVLAVELSEVVIEQLSSWIFGFGTKNTVNDKTLGMSPKYWFMRILVSSYQQWVRMQIWLADELEIWPYPTRTQIASGTLRDAVSIVAWWYNI